MDEKLYRSEPIPRRPQRSDFESYPTRPSRTPMNGSRPDARETIARIMADERFQSTMRSTTKQSVPQTDIVDASRRLTKSLDRIRVAISGSREGHTGDDLFSPTATHPTFDLPERYREMRDISRWQEGANGTPGRWLTEAELFWRQSTFMADWEDDCPYNGLFKSYFPTYNAMSDRQLRGYFTWRTAVRKGDIQETSLSFAYVYLYELINGIGVANPLDGFQKIETFWQVYRTFAPELDRYVNVWLQDYVVYHGLDPEPLAPYRTIAFDRALIALRHADAEMAATTPAAIGRRRRDTPTIPLPPDDHREDRLFQAVNALSSYHLTNSRLCKEYLDALRHVACAVYVRLSERHRKQGKNTLLESWFGEQVTLPYTMFGSAVFFEPARHADTVYELDEIHRYRCERGLWTCERFHGSRSRSPKLGSVMRTVDRSLREKLDPEHPLKDDGKAPKYLQKIIDQEIETWCTWSDTHAPVHIDIDLSQLAGIRSAAAETREALLIDEEREDNDTHAAEKTKTDASSERTREQRIPLDSKKGVVAPVFCAETQSLSEGSRETAGQLSSEQTSYLRALLDGNYSQTGAASEDLLVDAINEALFDLIGDTVIEYGPDGNPQLIEDYREDVEGILKHE